MLIINAVIGFIKILLTSESTLNVVTRTFVPIFTTDVKTNSVESPLSRNPLTNKLRAVSSFGFSQRGEMLLSQYVISDRTIDTLKENLLSE